MAFGIDEDGAKSATSNFYIIIFVIIIIIITKIYIAHMLDVS